MVRRLRRFYFRVLTGALVFVITSTSNYADTLEFGANTFPSVTTEKTLVPQAMDRTASGDLIVAGHFGGKAVAIKTNIAGDVQWQYSVDKIENFPHASSAEFRGISVARDSSVYLCGNMPRPPRSDAARAFLTKLDANGHKLWEIFISPKTRLDGVRPGGEIYGCANWGDDLILSGIASVLIPGKLSGELPTLSQYLWVMYVSEGGDIKWEKFIPAEYYKYGSSTPYFKIDGDMLFSATNGTDTLVIQLTVDGDIVRRKNIPGAFSFVRPLLDSTVIHMVGVNKNPESADLPVASIIVLGTDLDMVPNDSIALPSVYGTAYQLPDGDFAVVGGEYQRIGQTKTSAVTLIDGKVRSSRTFEFPLSHPPFSDGGGVVSVVPTNNPGEFVAARFVEKLDESSRAEFSVPQNFQGGLVLNIFQIK
jgi:hypothetical protein